jgi:hypothetical protein
MNKVMYNVTVSVDEAVHVEWLEWMKGVHIPDVMATGYFLENRLCRVHGFEEGGITYAVQYICSSMKDLEQYQAEQAPGLQADHQEKFGAHTAAFRTVLEILHEHE